MNLDRLLTKMATGSILPVIPSNILHRALKLSDIFDDVVARRICSENRSTRAGYRESVSAFCTNRHCNAESFEVTVCLGVC